jgi:uncharacterized protein (DUF1697 family)
MSSHPSFSEPRGSVTRRYVALLRAVNVGGHSTMKMEDLRALCQKAGFDGVRTYIQTGNIVLSSTETDASKVARKIERAIEAAMGYRTKAVVLSPKELKQAAARNPFKEDPDLRRHLMFLSGEPDRAARDRLIAMEGKEYRFKIHGKVLYYAYPGSYAGRRRNIDFEKLLGVSGTARTAKVVEKLIELAA